MTVYVDEPVHRYGRMIMCHMASPSLDELHAMAARIGVARRWFQDPLTMPRVSRPHYDVSKGMRGKAILLGAVAIDLYQMVVVTNVAMHRHLDAAGHPAAAHFADPFRAFRGGRRLAALEAWWTAEQAKAA